MLGRKNRFAQCKNGGFTLTEVVLSTALSGLIVSQVATTLISSQRLMEATMADVELSIQTRELREKLFYDINDDGGLMEANDGSLTFKSNGGGDSLSFRPKRGGANRVALGSNKRLKADNQKADRWLECGTMFFQGTNLFANAMTNLAIQVNVNVAISVRTRTYTQQHLFQTKVMNPQDN